MSRQASSSLNNVLAILRVNSPRCDCLTDISMSLAVKNIYQRETESAILIAALLFLFFVFCFSFYHVATLSNNAQVAKCESVTCSGLANNYS